MMLYCFLGYRAENVLVRDGGVKCQEGEFSSLLEREA